MIIHYQHTYSGHCESGTTSGLLRHNGLEISEPMVFGIGSGLYFSYLPFIKAQDVPLIAFRTLPGQIFKKATRRLNIPVRMINKFRDTEEAMEALDTNILQGIPTGVQVGTFHLKYFPPEYRLHYNFHNVVVFGKENGIYHISEPIRENTQLLARDDLQKARFARGMFGPKGRMYCVLNAPHSPNWEKAIRTAIKDTVTRMIKYHFPFIGVNGIRKLSLDMKRWPEKYPEDKAIFHLLQFVRSIEEFGTGGAGYRYIYGAFLKEAGALLRHEGLLSQSKHMGEIANTWRDFSFRSARFIKNRSETRDDFHSLSEILATIANEERQLFVKLDLMRF